MKVIIQELEDKIIQLKALYENNQKLIKLHLDYIQLIYNTFNSLPSINNYNIIKNLIINTTFNKPFLLLNTMQNDYDSLIMDLKYTYPLVISQKYSVILNSTNQKLIQYIEPLKGYISTYENSNVLNVHQKYTTELREHVSPIEAICVLDNGSIVSTCKNFIRILDKR